MEEIYKLLWTAVASKQADSKPFISGGLDYFVRTGWAGIGKGSFTRSAIAWWRKPKRTSADRFVCKLTLCRVRETQSG